MLAAAAGAGVIRELLLELLEQRANLRLLDFDVRQDACRDALDDLAVRSQQLLELFPEIHAHCEVAIAVGLGEDAGAGQLERPRGAVAPGELEIGRASCRERV